MAKRLFIFEDDKYGRFFPMTCNRPVYELLCGTRRIREKIESVFPEVEVTLLCRDHLKSVLKVRTGYRVNDLGVADEDDILLVSGRILAKPDLRKELQFSEAERFYFRGEDLVLRHGR